MRRNTVIAGVAIGAVVILATAGPAFAQAASPNALDQIPEQFQGKFAGLEASLSAAALRLFGLLALIEFTYAAMMLAFRQADFGEWAATLVNQILFIGIGLAILTNATAWGDAIVQSFRQAASNATSSAGGGATLNPSDIFNSGINIAEKILENVSIMTPAQSVSFAVGGLVVIVAFALIVAMMILTLVTAYGIVAMSVLFLGFGGSRWTRDVAMKAIMAIMGVGAKLFVLQIIVGIGASLFDEWAGRGVTTVTDMLVMVGFAIVMLALVKVIPDLVQAMISGAAFTGGGALAGAGAVVAGGAAGAAAGVVGASMAVGGAGKLASEQLATATGQGTAPTSKMGRLMSLAGNTGKNLGSAVMSDVGQRLGGRAPYGSMGGRMGMQMSGKAADMRAAREAAVPPPAAASTAANDSNGGSGGSDNTISA
ncbi:P-type conjugative transfer protein TrbL [Sphingomonas sp. ABOLF]|uniref:P-type conjugative transfer protein TrbL n=1 Tax=Sphingomonas sp. ABOLF TaxID=1985879 RepID=UPI000F7D5D10|nr:P-type conjugative transfer protein TrbL [Sphingomonas sp. ABOLF]RSV12388.1 P-type conjugative transfer protein TrbL [Sphingomonas sp. ABOLF]